MVYKVVKTENMEIKDESTGLPMLVFPNESNYKTGEFSWLFYEERMEDEEWKLNEFLGYNRLLIAIDGEVILAHEGHRVTRLKPGEVDTVDAGIKTKSFGNFRAYALAMRRGVDAQLEMVKVFNKNQDLLPPTGYELPCQWVMYVQSGYTVFTVGGETVMVEEGGSLLVDFDGGEKPKISYMGEGLLIWSRISLSDLGAHTEKIFEVHKEGNRESASQHGTWADFVMCMKLANSNFRGGKQIFGSLSQLWYDEALQKAISRIERFYLPFIVAMMGMLIVAFTILKLMGSGAVVWAIVIWLLLDILIISPMIYFIWVPKPVAAHMKRISTLTAYEQEIYKKQKKENPRLEKLLKKYTITGRNKYLDD